MDELNKAGSYLTSTAFFTSVIIVIFAFVLLVVIKKYLIKKVAYTTKHDEQHQNTFIGMLFNVLQYIVILVAIVLVMQVNGVNVTSIVAGLGIVGALVGLALQDTLKDVISGVNIYNNNFYKVGDMVRYGGEPCLVKYFSARVTKFQSMYTGATYTVCNSTINSIEKIKDSNILMMTFDFEDDKESIDKSFANAMEKVKDNKLIKSVEYYGLMDLNKEGLVYVANVHAGRDFLPARGAFIQALYEEFKKYNVSPSFEDERKIKEMNY